MKICVYGLWHLGCVTAACVAERFATVGLDPDPSVIAGLEAGKAPIFEPGLNELIGAGVSAGRLEFTNHAEVVADADVVWVSFDTPVDEFDEADYEYVIARIRDIFGYIRDGATVLISSQIPAGTTARLDAEYRRLYPSRHVAFAYTPENLRLGKALHVFRNPGRIVVGIRETSDGRARAQLDGFLGTFCQNLIWMSVESAEMTKHALNAFLANSVTFINEIAALCEEIGADAKQVEQGLKTDERIGPRAYLSPGGAFAGGTLARDLMFLLNRAKEKGLTVPLLEGIRKSNDQHKNWPRKTLTSLLGNMCGRTICVLGLTYKPGTDTLRRSTAVELCHWLAHREAKVRAFDPVVESLPPDLSRAIQLYRTVKEALTGAEAAIIATEWPLFREIRGEDLITTMRTALLLDPNRFAEKSLGDLSGIRYVAVGKPRELA